jgi:hypothetical protein
MTIASGRTTYYEAYEVKPLYFIFKDLLRKVTHICLKELRIIRKPFNDGLLLQQQTFFSVLKFKSAFCMSADSFHNIWPPFFAENFKKVTNSTVNILQITLLRKLVPTFR